MAHQSFLRLQRALEEDDILEFLGQLLRQVLLLADGIKLVQIVLIAGCIVATDLDSLVIQVVEILAQIMTASRLHLFRQIADT